MTSDDSVKVLTEDDCCALLQAREVGRIAFEFEGKVEIFPVNYGMDWHDDRVPDDCRASPKSRPIRISWDQTNLTIRVEHHEPT